MRERPDDTEDTEDERPRRRARVVRVRAGETESPRAPAQKTRGRTVAGMPWWLAAIIAGVIGLPIVSCVGLVAVSERHAARNPEWAARVKRESAERDAAQLVKNAEDKAAAEASTKVFTRGQFENLVLNRTEEQVIKAVGKPDSTQSIGGGTYWYYSRRTKDSVTGNTDLRAQVHFGPSLVKSVSFY